MAFDGKNIELEGVKLLAQITESVKRQWLHYITKNYLGLKIARER